VDRDVDGADIGRLEPQPEVPHRVEGFVVVEVHLPIAAD
jgi:hypothetical protein